ncbi:glycosyltransferase family 4 protein [Bacillus sp. FJAT-29814]|uniref:glycosyltransferase family 4 protein n=1 Tax=Bacillus sp. FJAT-29814 TaxID=1729688 RepID=UPI00082D81A3|nr:glycosyltransferase family 4 protein [Bacillus sp. FJAT-29814]
MNKVNNDNLNVVYISLATSPGMQRYTNSIFTQAINFSRCHLITSKYYDYDEENTYKLVSMRKPSINKEFFYVNDFIKVIRKINKLKPDIVHFLSDHPWNYFISLFLKKYKVVYTLHDPIPHPGEGISKFKEIHNSLVFFNKNILLLLHGQSQVDYLKEEKNIEANRIKYVKLATENPSEKYSELIEHSTFLFFGRIRPYKGLENFIMAFEQVLKQNKNSKAIIAGEGSMDEYLPLIKSKERYEILNYEIPEDQIETIFRKSSVVVLPYNSATQSGITSLAYYFSRPVIAHNVGSLSEYVVDGETGFLISKDKNNIPLMDKMSHIISDPDRLKQLSINSFNYLNNSLTAEKMVKDMIGIYQSL